MAASVFLVGFSAPNNVNVETGTSVNNEPCTYYFMNFNKSSRSNSGKTSLIFDERNFQPLKKFILFDHRILVDQ